jgi:acetolactate synthase regulatory subunit
MKSVLEIRLDNREGALERVLGCLRQRGFEICSMEMQRSSDKSSLVIQCTVESARPIDGVRRQLEKQYDIHTVKVQYSEATAGEGYARIDQSSQREVSLSV